MPGIPPSDSDAAIIEEKYALLLDRLRAWGRVAVAFSGGVDSALLLKVATLAVGPENALGITVHGPIFPSWEIEVARAIAREHGLTLREVEASPLGMAEFDANPPDRCYHCKRFLFSQMMDIARREGFSAVLDGANVDDTFDHRPGMRATRELDVRSPLKDAGLTKAEIRALARRLGLANWDEPSAACLASRVPYGQPIDAAKLARIDAAERFLREAYGIRQIRVRHDGATARIEAPAGEIARLARPRARQRILAQFNRLGFVYVCLDLNGYRTGSLNETLPSRRQ